LSASTAPTLIATIHDAFAAAAICWFFFFSGSRRLILSCLLGVLESLLCLVIVVIGAGVSRCDEEESWWIYIGEGGRQRPAKQVAADVGFPRYRGLSPLRPADFLIRQQTSLSPRPGGAHPLAFVYSWRERLYLLRLAP